MQKRAELMGDICDILQNFADQMRLTTQLSEEAEISQNFDRISRHAFIAWVHSTFPEGKAVITASNRTHWKPILNYVVPDQDRKDGDCGVVRHISTKTFLVDYMGKADNMKYGC